MEIKDLIKGIKYRRRFKSGYIFVPYIMCQTTPIISGSFSPKQIVSSRYSLVTSNNNYFETIKGFNKED